MPRKQKIVHSDNERSLRSAIDGVKSPSDFASFQLIDNFTDPQLTVDAWGPVALPLQEVDAQRIIAASHEAPQVLGGSDCTQETEHRGNPQTLVVTKKDRKTAAHDAWKQRCREAQTILEFDQDDWRTLLRETLMLHELVSMKQVVVNLSRAPRILSFTNPGLTVINTNQKRAPTTVHRRKLSSESSGEERRRRPKKPRGGILILGTYFPIMNEL